MTVEALQRGMYVPHLCRELIEHPQDNANSHNRWGTLYKTAAVVAALASIILFTGATAIWLGLIAAPEWVPVAGALLSVVSYKLSSNFWSFGNDQFALANKNQLIADKLAVDDDDGGVGDWNALQIGGFFNENNLLPHLFTPEALEAMNRQSPVDHRLFSLLPLIARFKVLTEQAEKLKVAYATNVRIAEENVVPGREESELRHRFAAVHMAEDLAFIQLNRAVILENLRFPEREYAFGDVYLKGPDGTDEILAKGLNVSGQEEGAGVLLRKNEQMRAVDYIAGRPREFFHTSNHVPITLEELRDSEPKDIRAKIFDVPQPVPDLVEQPLV